MLKSTTFCVVLFVFFLLPQQASACRWNTDCSVGSECKKERGNLKGLCVGGLSPGNDHDKDPYVDRWARTEKIGDTCNFDLDCGIGNSCIKSGIYGTCVKDDSRLNKDYEDSNNVVRTLSYCDGFAEGYRSVCSKMDSKICINNDYAPYREGKTAGQKHGEKICNNQEESIWNRFF